MTPACVRLGVLLGLLGLVGCGPVSVTPLPGPAPIVAQDVVSEPGEMELSEAKVHVDERNIARFEVRYRFTKGKPSKYYQCEIRFPGTNNQGIKPMESWELKMEGVIKDGIVLQKPPVSDYEIHVSEADSPQLGYKIISNVIKGKVE